jgi:uncharacterized protein (DUF2062 family)
MLERLRTVGRQAKQLLGEGLTPRRLALGLALSVTVAVFPVFLLPALVCAFLALILRLNQPLMQAINYVVGPVQIVLFVPFMRLGESVFEWQRFPLSFEALRDILDKGVVHTMGELSTAIIHAAAGWALVAPCFLVAMYFLLLPLLKRVSTNRKRTA